MTNRIQLRRSSTPGNIPTLESMLTGELAVNVADKDLFISTGAEVLHLNHAANIKTDAGHRFLSDTKLAELEAAASASVLGNVKIGTNIDVAVDGTISLKTASSTDTGVLSATDWATFNGKQADLGYAPVNKAGDTMSGALVLPGAPSADNEASNKKYVDDGLALKINKAGDTMTGLLVLSADPEQNLGAATKQYVDLSVNNISGKYAAPVQTLLDLSAVAPASREDKQMRLVEDTGAIYRFDAQSSAAADGAGVIAPDDAPITGRWLKVSAATQNHEVLYGLQGGAEGDHLHLTTAEKNSYDTHLTDTALHLTAGQNTWLDAITATSAEVNYLSGVTSSIQTQLNGKQADLGYTPVNIAGDTMTGALTLSGAPTADLHAATKAYVDNAVIDGGSF
jgi:hypothetical protein